MNNSFDDFKCDKISNFNISLSLNSLENKETQASSLHLQSFKSKQGSFEMAQNDDKIEHLGDIQKLKQNNIKRDSKFQQFQLLFKKLEINLDKRKELESIKNHDIQQKNIQQRQQRRQSLRQSCLSLEKNMQNGDICMTPLKKSQSNLYNQYQNYDQDPEICDNMIKYENEKQFIYDQKNESLPGSAKQNSKFCNFSIDNNNFEQNLKKQTSLEKIEKDIQNNIYHENFNQQSDFNSIKYDLKIDELENKLQNSTISKSSETSFQFEDSIQLEDTAKNRKKNQSQYQFQKNDIDINQRSDLENKIINWLEVKNIRWVNPSVQDDFFQKRKSQIFLQLNHNFCNKNKKSNNKHNNMEIYSDSSKSKYLFNLTKAQSHTKINQEQQFLTTEALPTLLQKRKSQNKKFEQINTFHSTSCIRE